MSLSARSLVQNQHEVFDKAFGTVYNSKDFVVELQKGKVLQDQIIKDQKTLSENDVVDVSDVDFTKEDKKGISLLYIGLGAIVLVGATILIVRK